MKYPTKILKKKVTQRAILYKVVWSNGSYSYEPLVSMEEDLLVLVQRWEIYRSGLFEDELSPP
jgi:hypothetical protein